MRTWMTKLTVLMMLTLMVPGLALAKANWPEKLVFGVIPVESGASITDRFEPLVAHMQKELGMPIEFKTSTDYAGVITGMQFKHVDFAYFGPKSYVEASRRANAQAVVLEVGQDGTKGYHGMIITKKGSGLKSMDDIKGKIWAFTDPNSTSGTLVPTVFFNKEMKIVPDEHFSKVIYSGSHAASIMAVKNGKVDAASTNDLDMLRGNGKTWNKDNDFNVLWTSKLIPGSPMAVRGDLPTDLKEAIKQAFLNFNDPAGLDKLKISGFTNVADSTYDPIRELIEAKKQLAKK